MKRINPAVEPETEKNNGPFYFALSKHEPDAIAFCNNAFLPNACSASLPQLTDASDDSSIQNDVMPPKYQMEFCARKICRSCVVNLQRQRNDLQNDAKHHQLVALNEDALWTSSLRNPQWMCSQCYAERSPYPSTSVAQLCVSPYVCPYVFVSRIFCVVTYIDHQSSSLFCIGVYVWLQINNVNFEISETLCYCEKQNARTTRERGQWEKNTP